MTTSYKMLSTTYAPGSSEIWYAKPEFDGYLGAVPGAILSDTHIKLGFVPSTDLEQIFCAMQSEHWSPNGEARGLISGLGLDHTSMSVGDVIETPDGVRHLVAGCGFKTL
jgi:hypothetical protein